LVLGLEVMMKNVVLGSVLAATLLLLNGCGGSDEDGPKTSSKTIADLASDEGTLSTLATALQKADLVRVLNGTDNYTVFAPTNKAFKALDPNLLKCLLNPVAKSTLAALLKYHVVAGTTMAKDLSNVDSLTTLDNDTKLKVKKVGDTVMVNKANVSQADLNASNGVVHVIDGVLTPDGFESIATDTVDQCGTQTVADLAAGTKSLTSLTGALSAADLVEVFNSTNSTAVYTVFAPTNKAFKALDANLLKCLLKPAGKDALTALLKYHVLNVYKVAKDLMNDMNLTTIDADATLAVLIKASGTYVNDANITKANNYATNGVVHVIDEVLIPVDWVKPSCDATPSSIQV